MKLPKMSYNLSSRLKVFFNFYQHPLYLSGMVLLSMGVIVFALSYQFIINDFNGFYYQILIESYGMLLDFAVIGILLFWVNKNRENRQLVRTCKDEIEDFKFWESEEAAYRTVGNIKRLNRYNIHEIDLVKTYLVQTNLSYINLMGSNLNLANLYKANLIGSNLTDTRLNQINLENANLSQADLRNCYATGANFKGAFMIKSKLNSSFLINADFSNSYLMEADLRGADLTGVNFQDASLYKADLRGAIGITIDQLSKAKTLNFTQLDHEIKNELGNLFPELIGKED